MRDKIISLYGPSMLRKSALNIRGGAGVFERVLSGKGYGTVLEIGTYRGVAAAEMSRYCERVITIDLRYGKLEQNGDAFDRHGFWESLGIDNIEFHAVDDDTEKKALVDALCFDFAFIDGAHDATIKNDFALVRRCGRVLFHDYDRRNVPGQDHVCNFVDSLPANEIQAMDIFALWTAA